jgi:thioredoxin reductase (NADPH)
VRPGERDDEETLPVASLPDQPSDDTAFPTLSAEQLRRIETYGAIRPVEVGDVLYHEGQDSYPFIVILEGAADIVRRSWDGEAIVAHHVAGRFLGELNLLTGQKPYLTARVTEPGRVVVIPIPELRRLLAEETELADLILAALMARRVVLEQGEGARTLQIIGSRFSPETLHLRDYVARNRLPHLFVDLEDLPEVDTVLARWGVRPADAPVVVTPTAVLRHPTPGELAEHLGLAYRPTPGHTFDVVVVGAGPAGLAAAVYGASEGLDTVVVDAVAAGGQAGSSSRIENYLGFPSGISGGDLAALAQVQATKFGARLNSPCEVAALIPGDTFHTLVLGDGSEIPARTIVVATGAHYRRLPLDGWSALEGAGIYYAATNLEARTCALEPVVVLGGGNSAGQAALYLAGQGAQVDVVIRGADLGASMSRYLVSRIEAHPAISVRTRTNVTAVWGEGGHLAEVELTAADEGALRQSCRALFCFIGAEPATGWLPAEVARDAKGFLLTDRDLDGQRLPFETSVAGVFAVGDCRLGSLKRVAAAVGEGSSAIRSVHTHLAGST